MIFFKIVYKYSHTFMKIVVCVCVWSSVAEHLIAQHSAIKMLHSRVKVILEYVKAVQAGETPQHTHMGENTGPKSHACFLLEKNSHITSSDSSGVLRVILIHWFCYHHV